MSKSRSAPKSNGEPLVAELDPMPNTQLVTTDFKIDQDDLLSVAILESEERMRAAMKEQQAIGVAQQQIVDDCMHKADAAVKAPYANVYADEVAVLIAALKPFKKGKFEVFRNVSLLPEGEKYGKREKPACNLTLRVRSVDRNQTYLDYDEKLAVPAEALTLLKEADEARQQVAAANAEALKIKRALSDMPATERLYRAKLAKQRVGETAAGRKLLDALCGNLQDDMLRLTSR